MLCQRRTLMQKLANVLQINVICLDFNTLVEIIGDFNYKYVSSECYTKEEPPCEN